jgi:hypothetical protein
MTEARELCFLMDPSVADWEAFSDAPTLAVPIAACQQALIRFGGGK